MKFIYLLALFILADLCFSFVQHQNFTLDGDLASISLPSDHYSKVLEDPFGVSVITENQRYAGPNRFFIHWFMHQYFTNVPLFLQNFVNPIDSLYLAIAFLKTLIQFMILLLLSWIITKSWNWKSLILVSAIMLPFIQNSGYYNTMGIISQSVTYACFYILPFCFLILFLILISNLRPSTNRPLFIFQLTISLILAFSLPFSGPIISPLLLIIGGLFGLAWIFAKPIPWPIQSGKWAVPIFALSCLLSLYSFYIGQNNMENSTANLPVLERFYRLPTGYWFLLKEKLGIPILLLGILINSYIAFRFQVNWDRLRIILFCSVLFFFLYSFLLPLGGYREYRPYVVRRDTILPILILAFYLYGQTSYWLLNAKNLTRKRLFVGYLILVGLIFMAADLPKFETNDCERAALQELADSPLEEVQLTNDCLIMSWIKINDPVQSKVNGAMLYKWKVTKTEKQYFQ